MNRAALERRVQALEARFGLDGPDGAAGTFERAQEEIEAGTAGWRTFVPVLTPDIVAAWRALLAVRSLWFRQLRREGFEPALASPLDVACSIASVPPAWTAPPGLVHKLLELARPPAGPDGERWARGAAPSQSRRDEYHRACTLVVALGRPDGLPLRRAIAAGRLATARRILAVSELEYLLEPPCNSWRRWIAASTDLRLSPRDITMYIDASPSHSPLCKVRARCN